MKASQIITGLLFTAMALFAFDQCTQKAAAKRETTSLINTAMQASPYFEAIAKNQARQQDMVVEMTNRQSRLLVTNAELAKEVHALQAKVGIRYITEFDTIRDTTWADQIIRTDSGPALRLPVKFQHRTKWLSLTQTIDTLGINTYSGIQTWDSVTIHHYAQKRRLKDVLKPRALMVYAEFSSPYARIDGMHSITIKPEKRFYEKPWVWGLAGLAIGAAIQIVK